MRLVGGGEKVGGGLRGEMLRLRSLLGGPSCMNG